VYGSDKLSSVEVVCKIATPTTHRQGTPPTTQIFFRIILFLQVLELASIFLQEGGSGTHIHTIYYINPYLARPRTPRPNTYATHPKPLYQAILSTSPPHLFDSHPPQAIH